MNDFGLPRAKLEDTCMRFRLAVLPLLCLSFALLAISKSSAVNSSLHVDESATGVLLREGKTDSN